MYNKNINDFKRVTLKLVFTVLLIVSVNLTGCKHKTGAVSQAQNDAFITAVEEVNRSSSDIITIYFACPEQDVEKFTELSNAFHDQNPSVIVEIVSLEDVRDGATNQDIDRLVMSRVDTAYYWATYEGVVDGSFLDLRPFINADENFEIDDFFSTTLTAFEYQGGTWALPSEARVYYLLYDRDIFDAAHVDYPDTGWTHEDFLSAAQGITTNKENRSQFGYWDNSFVRGAFISFFSDRNSNDNGSLGGAAIAEDIRWYTDLALSHSVMFAPPRTNQGFEEASELVQSGNVGMWGGEWVEYEWLKDTRNLGISLYPTKEGPRALGHMYGYVISSGSQHPQESWQWLEFLSYQTISDGRSLPPRRSVAEATGYWNQFEPEDEDFTRFAAENLVIVSSVKPGTHQLSAAIDSVLSGMPVEEALAEAETNLAQRIAFLSKSSSFVVDTPVRERPISIRFASSQNSNAIYHALATEFHKLQEDIQIDLLLPTQINQSDCFVDQKAVDPLYPPDDLLNLESFLTLDEDLHLDDFHPVFIESLRSRGELYGLPLQAQVRVIFYNVGIFEEGGVNFPPSDWTLDDFLSLAISLTNTEGQNKQYGFLPLNGDESDLRVFLSIQGASTLESANEFRLDSPQMINALQWYTDLALQHGVSPLYPSTDDPEAEENRNMLVRNGNVAMWSDFVGVDRRSIWPEETTIGIAPLPIGAIKGTDFLPEAFFIASDTPQAEACWKWISFLSSRPELVTAMPARRSTLEMPEFAIQAWPGEIEAYQAMQNYENLLVELNAITSYEEIIQALYEVYAGSTPDRALQLSQAQVEQ